MPDTPSHGASQPDLTEARHTLTVREVEATLAEAGIQRSHRHVLRLCQSGMLDAVKIPGGPSGEEWYVAPASVPKAIGDLKQIDAQRARRAAPQPAMSDSVVVASTPDNATDMPRHSTPQPDVSELGRREDVAPTQPDMARHSTTDLDIYEHPYVKRLETQIEKLEVKYEAQVRRTEDLQLRAQEKLVELQRMTTIGQSKTLADFMLQAKNWIIGAEPEDVPPAGERPVTNARVDNATG